jgi:EmrB/QacA subfamily drug resistance transporter
LTTRYHHLITDENRKWWTLGAMCFALFMIMLDNTVVNVALPSIQRDLHTSVSELEWTLNGYTLTFAVLLATGGRLGDIFGRRLFFMAGVAIFAITSATAGFATDPTMLIISRAVQGVGAALMMPATLSIVTQVFPPQERGKAIGTWAGVSALALTIGPVVGGLLTEHVSWRAIFYINLPVAALALFASLVVVRESRDETIERRVDYLGVATLTAGLAAIVLALIEGNGWGWGSPTIVSLLIGGFALLALFVAVEQNVRAPMIEFVLFRTRNFIGSTLVAFVITFAMMGSFFFMAIYMQDVLGYSPLEAGIRFLPTTVLIVGIAPIAGRLSDRIGAMPPMAAGLAVLAAAMYLFAQVTPSTTFSDILPPFMLMGAGIALVMSPMSTAAMNAVEMQKAGIASGILQMARMIGGSVGIAATGAIFQSKLGSGFDPASLAAGSAAARATFIDALGSAMGLAALVSALGFLIAVTFVRGRGQTHGVESLEPAAEVVERAAA